MSVYKEDAFMLTELMEQQHQIYTDAADAGYITSELNNNAIGSQQQDAKSVLALHNFVKENKEFGKITKSKNWWMFTKRMVEGNEDGREWGWEAVISFHKDPVRLVNFVSVNIRSL